MGFISCPVASLLYQEGKEEGRTKLEERSWKNSRKNIQYGGYFSNFDTNDTNGHDITFSAKIHRTKKTVENRDSFYLDIGLTNIGALGTAHYSHPPECNAYGSKALWEFLILYLKRAINIGINDYTNCTPK